MNAGQHQAIKSAKGSRNIPSLDGLRAVSVALVILAHARGTRGFPAWIPYSVAERGVVGVQIFFVISGFLITTLLTEELAATGAISLSLFYARRTLRIFPPFYLFLATIAVGGWMGFFDVPLRSFLAAATFTMNYISNGVWITGHTWSLAVEEQFYLVWPLTFRLAGPRRAFWIAGALAVAGPPFCLAVGEIDPNLAFRLVKSFPFVADAIAAGCVLSGALPWLRRHERIMRWAASPWGDLAIPLVLLLTVGDAHVRLRLGLTEILQSLCICYAIVRYTEFPKGGVARLLNLPAVSYVGRLSYSLYLWQEVFVNPDGKSLLQSFPLNILASFACACVSYYLVELPLAGIRKRLRPRNVMVTSGARHG
jgi:peptidoglycan/LPS O-acetylase OafA/YrhL